MAKPTIYTRAADFSSLVSGLNEELDEVNNSVAQIISNLAILQRDDTQLQNGIVKILALSSDVVSLLKSTVSPRGAWVTATAYSVGDSVTESGAGYICVTAHTAGTFVTDLGNGNWMKYYDDDAVWHTIGGAGEPAYQNTWGLKSGFTDAGFYKRQGMVYLRGVLACTASNEAATIFTLPADYQPAEQRTILTSTDGGTGKLVIATDGNVNFASGGHATTSNIDGVFAL